MGKYAKRSETARKNLVKKYKELVESRGFEFIDLEVEVRKSTNYYVIFSDGDRKVRQHTTSFKKGLISREDYLQELIKYPKGSGVYLFYIQDEIVYVGKTKHFHQRFCEHFSKKSSPLMLYKGLITKIDYCELNDADTNIYEQYLIATHKPRLNTSDVPVNNPSFKLPELNYCTYWVGK